MQLFHSLILENAQAREEDAYRVTKQLCALNDSSRPEEYEFRKLSMSLPKATKSFYDIIVEHRFGKVLKFKIYTLT